MPMHQGFLPREGFCADVVLKLLRRTALNPAFLLPFLLLARFTKQGQDLSVLHPIALKRIRALFYVAVARVVGGWLSAKSRNNWVTDKYDWTKEIVVVTGGAAGIGASIVKLFEEQGITVIVLDVQPLTFTPSSKVHYYKCDLRSPENVSAVADKIRAEVGHPTVVINNAGVARGKSLLEAKPGDIRFTFDVNTLAHYWVAQAFLPNIVAKNHGMIVTVASYASWLTIPNMVDYGASKAAALSFHEGLTAELTTRYNAPKVRTVIVHPGHTKTPLFVGYDQNTAFTMPTQEPESIAEGVVRQVLSGNSGDVILPELGATLAGLRMFPDFYTYPLRAKGHSYMANFSGRQVIADVDAAVDKESDGQDGPSESTVLVSGQ
ncbi:hypothetical protein S40285_00596 [Stachybotrys chlorohalonatus IBT 40285]|uniref:Short-chain dehydrogenase/reductase 3 n=1 Tax=Stachybotrys chlorohalonatus (strain IBT 40285) TaxID=1283841 RepID=A0A084R2J5_STAC4|nr:hypothetical protein S40285_00596 [Stachybotrys chlorohalonata IBT 40285]